MKRKMKHRNGLITMIVFVMITVFSCKPDPMEYARPENLAGTIYAQLESMGTFNYYLQCLDQTSFKEPLTKGGSWTVFAYTDEAFEQFMADEGYANFEAIPAERILHMVEYSIIVNGWNTTTLTYYTNQFYEGGSFRRFTQYQDPVVAINSEDYPHLVNAEFIEPGTYLVDTSRGDMKTTDYFLPAYMTFDRNNTAISDYDYMFPGETMTEDDMKVFEAHVSQQNIVAENGMLYALDKVIEPRKNLYQNLSSEKYNDKYSIFKKLLERFASLNFRGNEINEETGETEPIYTFGYLTGIENNLLPYNPDEESYPRLLNNVDRTLANAPGLLVPTNEALENYLNGNSILGQYYDSYDDMPLDVLGKFLAPNFFIWFWDLCPSNFGQSFNVGLELIDYKEEDVVDKEFCSNGFFVGVNKVYTNNSFATIMGPLLLDPDYALMLQAVQRLGIDTALQSNGVNFTIFGIKNNQFIDIADPNSATRRITVVDYNEDLEIAYMEVTGDPTAANNRIYPDPNVTNPSSADIDYVNTTLQDIVLNQIVDANVDLNSNNYYQTRSGEFIYAYDGNKVAGGDDLLNNTVVEVESEEVTENGIFYNMSRHIERPFLFTYGALKSNEETFSSFLQVLASADALVDIAGSDDKLVSFLNLQKTFSLIAPNNTAITQAISDGVIPDPDPSYLGTLDPLGLATAKKALLDFAKKHFLQQAVPTDGQTVGTFPSMYFGKVIDFVPVYDEFIIANNYGASSLTLTNEETGEVITTGGISNLLSKRVVIHETNNYIK